MSTFVDTSAFYAVIDAGDEAHSRAKSEWRRLLHDDADLYTTNYVLVETMALLQSRIGLAAVRLFAEDIAPVLQILWIDAAAHGSAMQLLTTANRRDLSLVDCVSFQAIRTRKVREVFCFDPHFAEQGFRVRPAGRESD
jgi:predicted nucleic acid-binding protein